MVHKAVNSVCYRPKLWPPQWQGLPGLGDEAVRFIWYIKRSDLTVCYRPNSTTTEACQFIWYIKRSTQFVIDTKKIKKNQIYGTKWQGLPGLGDVAKRGQQRPDATIADRIAKLAQAAREVPVAFRDPAHLAADLCPPHYTKRPACAAGSPPDCMRCYQPPTAGNLIACVATSRRPRSARIGSFEIPDGQTNAGAA